MLKSTLPNENTHDVGAGVGDDDGCAVGDAVGKSVGASVGAFVGASVASKKHSPAKHVAEAPGNVPCVHDCTKSAVRSGASEHCATPFNLMHVPKRHSLVALSHACNSPKLQPVTLTVGAMGVPKHSPSKQKSGNVLLSKSVQLVLPLIDGRVAQLYVSSANAVHTQSRHCGAVPHSSIVSLIVQRRASGGSGDCVGSNVGTTGDAVGARVGDTLGERVGCAVGAAVLSSAHSPFKHTLVSVSGSPSSHGSVF